MWPCQPPIVAGHTDVPMGPDFGVRFEKPVFGLPNALVFPHNIYMIRRHALLLTVILFGCGRQHTPPPAPTAQSTKKMPAPELVLNQAAISDLDRLLKDRGYVAVPLLLTKDGFYDVEVKVNGQPLLFLVDTAAGTVTLDTPVAERLKLPLRKSEETLAGSTGDQPAVRTDNVQLTVGPNECGAVPIVSDHSAVNSGRKTNGSPPCDGILGNNVMQIFGALIHHGAAKMYLLDQPFSMPVGLKAKSSLNISWNEGRVARAIVVEFPQSEPPLVFKTAYERLQPGMSFDQVSDAIGGELKKGHLNPSYSGTLALVQGQGRINLDFWDGKVTARSAQGIDGTASQDKTGVTATRPAPTVVTDFLRAARYQEIPLVLTKDGIFDLEVKVNGQTLLMGLDTGANNTVIDTRVAERLKLPITKLDGTFAGITGSGPLRSTALDQLVVGIIASPAQPYVSDLSATNAQRQKIGLPPWDGTLGNNFLREHHAVIDETTWTLFLK
jgi:predicted aspartyl protease